MSEEQHSDAKGVAQDIDWKDYRDHLATADQQGRRLWIYPKKPSGQLYRLRTLVSWVLLVILFVGPFIKINGNPLLMFNIPERKFSLFGAIFWPQDLFLFALIMLVVFVMVVLSTAVYGRIWCGWLCPQTVLMEMLFRKIEYAIDGDANEQRMLSKAPWKGAKIRKRVLKHGIFFALSFIIGNLLLAYIIGSDRLIEIITDNPINHTKGLTAMILFALLFYGIFARFREQACTFVCPYGRFQSVLLDERSIVVAYDHKRGENRGKFKKTIPVDERRSSGLGDCIDCGACVRVCPTGIDIRNGTQMECVNCTACIDACDSVMERIGLPRGLVRYASMENIESGSRFKVTPRLAIYTVVLAVLTGLLGYLLTTRSVIETSLLRTPGSLYQKTEEGNLNNLYLLNLLNKTNDEIPVELRLENIEGKLTVAGGDLVVKGGSLAQTAVIIELSPDSLAEEKTPLEVGVYSEGKLLETVKTSFLGPGKTTSSP